MVDTTNKPKQMTVYDKFQIVSDEEYILCDDAYYSGEVEETICENPLRDLEECDFCSTQLIKVENNTLEKEMHRDYCLWYCDYCRFWQARIYSAFRAYHRIIGLIGQNYGSLIQTYLKNVVKN